MISEADGRRDGNVSSFASIIPPGFRTAVYRGWSAEEWEVGRNGVRELTRAK